MVREPDATMQPAPQDNQLMAKHRVLSFKPHRRLEWRGQDGHNEKEQPNHSTSLGDSITSSTRIRFSVHTSQVKHRFSKNSEGLQTWPNPISEPNAFARRRVRNSTTSTRTR